MSSAGDLRVADIGEDALVAGLLSLFAPGAGLLVGPGDDAAVLTHPGLSSQDDAVVVCTDTLVQDVDFRLDWSTAHDIGVKLAAQNLADVAAMGARCTALVVNLTMPGSTPVGWVHELARGVAQEAARAGAQVVGGDVSSGPLVVLSGTALGAPPAAGWRPIRRSGALPGDDVVIAGVVGPSAAGLDLLRAGLDADQLPGRLASTVEWVLAAHRRPAPPYAAGLAAADVAAHAMIDISDGLLRDLARIAAASQVLLELDPAALGPDPQLTDLAAMIGRDAQEWVLSGGEDHALAATVPVGVLPVGFRRIGTVRPPDGSGPGVQVGVRRYRSGSDDGGWTHFRSASPTAG